MEPSSRHPVDPQRAALVLWVLWAAFQLGVCMLYFTISPSARSPGSGASLDTLDDKVWLLALIPLLLSAVVRWIILPRATSITGALPMMVIGIALAEFTCLIGIFMFPVHRQTLFIFSFLGILQFVPLYAARLAERQTPDTLRP